MKVKKIPCLTYFNFPIIIFWHVRKPREHYVPKTNEKTKIHKMYPSDNEILIDLSIFSRQNQFHYHIAYAHALL